MGEKWEGSLRTLPDGPRYARETDEQAIKEFSRSGFSMIPFLQLAALISAFCPQSVPPGNASPQIAGKYALVTLHIAFQNPIRRHP